MLDRDKVYAVRIRRGRTSRSEYLNELRAEKDSPLTLVVMASLIVDRKKDVYLNYREIENGSGHYIRGKVIRNTRNGLVFESAEGKNVYTFAELTLDLFKRRVRPFMDEADSRILQNIDDVFAYYRHKMGMP